MPYALLDIGWHVPLYPIHGMACAQAHPFSSVCQGQTQPVSLNRPTTLLLLLTVSGAARKRQWHFKCAGLWGSHVVANTYAEACLYHQHQQLDGQLGVGEGEAPALNS